MNTTYRIVLNGAKVGTDATSVRANLAKLFKAKPEQIEGLLASPGHVLKRGLSAAVAAQYKAALENAGAVCLVEPEVVEPPIPNAGPASGHDGQIQENVAPAVAATQASSSPATSGMAESPKSAGEVAAQAATTQPTEKAGRAKLIVLGATVLVVGTAISIYIGDALRPKVGPASTSSAPGTAPSLAATSAVPAVPNTVAAAPPAAISATAATSTSVVRLLTCFSKVGKAEDMDSIVYFSDGTFIELFFMVANERAIPKLTIAGTYEMHGQRYQRLRRGVADPSRPVTPDQLLSWQAINVEITDNISDVNQDSSLVKRLSHKIDGVAQKVDDKLELNNQTCNREQVDPERSQRLERMRDKIPPEYFGKPANVDRSSLVGDTRGSSAPASPGAAGVAEQRPASVQPLIGGWECLVEGRNELRRAVAYFDDGTFLIQGDGGSGQTAFVTGSYTWRDNRLTDTESIAMVTNEAGSVIMPWRRSAQGNDLNSTNYKIHEFSVTWDSNGGMLKKRLRTSTGTGVSDTAPSSEPATTCVTSGSQFARLKKIRDTVPPGMYGASASRDNGQRAHSTGKPTGANCTKPADQQAAQREALAAREAALKAVASSETKGGVCAALARTSVGPTIERTDVALNNLLNIYKGRGSPDAGLWNTYCSQYAMAANLISPECR